MILIPFLADPDGNVIFELNKAEIDDAHKDKQKMFSENFKVSFKSSYNVSTNPPSIFRSRRFSNGSLKEQTTG